MLAFDLDRTLFWHTGRGPNYNDPQHLRLSTRPIQDRCAHVGRLLDLGKQVAFVTGRGRVHRDHTMDALRAYVNAAIQPGQLHCQERWTTYEAMAQWKATVLNEIGATLFVGDHWADRQAASLAGIQYEDHDEYFGPFVSTECAWCGSREATSIDTVDGRFGCRAAPGCQAGEVLLGVL